jgi:enamine deaminase RidA (YjgF/YER057c/UK114 family)
MKRSNPPALHKPVGYTHIVEAAPRRTVYISGQVAIEQAGTLVGPGDLAAQAEQVFKNLRAALESAGATFEDVAKITVFMVDASQIQVYRDARARHFTGHLPASTLVQVVRLARPEWLIEIEAIATVEEARAGA